MQNVTAQSARELNAAIQEAMQQVAKKFGLMYAPEKGAKYDDTSFKCSVKFVVEGGEKSKFEMYAKLMGVPGDWLGKTFLFAPLSGVPHTMRITSLEPGRSKYPISVEDVKTGKRFKMTLESVKAYMAKTEKEQTSVSA